jgi:magnesium chelatase accessory protein
MLAIGEHRLDWARDGARWPNRTASRFVTVSGIRWHVQTMGRETDPELLLLHGTGASTHSFRDLMPRLAKRFRVIACDLPGHGFTVATGADTLSLDGMAVAVSRLLSEVREAGPLYAAGHSAGAAVLLSMADRKRCDFAHIVGINAALEPMRGNALLSPLAKLLFVNPFTPRLLSWQARSGSIANTVLSGTGSPIDEDMRRCYLTLFRNSAHVRGALGMMANWDLAPLRSRFRLIDTAVTLIAAEDDPMVPARISREAAGRFPDARHVEVPRGGHLLHEIDPESVASTIEDLAVAEDEDAVKVAVNR